MIRHTARCIVVLVVAAGAVLSAADWPHWRGPNGTGTTDETGMPVTWSASENIAWKAPIAGLGVSTPIVTGNRVFVTSQLGDSRRRATISANGRLPRRLVSDGQIFIRTDDHLFAVGARSNR